MHALVAEIALLLAAVFGVFATCVALALLLGGKTLPRSVPASCRKTGAECPDTARDLLPGKRTWSH